MSKFTEQQVREIRGMIAEALSGDVNLDRFMPEIDVRLASTRHESGDHSDRALAVRKLTPGGSGQVLRSVAPTSRAGGVYADWSDAVSPYYAGLYLDITGSPTHSGSGSWQNVADGGGTDAWTAICDIRPSGVSAHLDLDANDGTITVRKTGVYSISYSIGFTYQADQAVIGAGIQINSGDPTKLAAVTRVSGAGICRLYRHQFETLGSGDVLSLSAFQASGGSSAYTSGNMRDNYMAIMYVGPSS